MPVLGRSRLPDRPTAGHQWHGSTFFARAKPQHSVGNRHPDPFAATIPLRKCTNAAGSPPRFLIAKALPTAKMVFARTIPKERARRGGGGLQQGSRYATALDGSGVDGLGCARARHGQRRTGGAPHQSPEDVDDGLHGLEEHVVGVHQCFPFNWRQPNFLTLDLPSMSHIEAKLLLECDIASDNLSLNTYQCRRFGQKL